MGALEASRGMDTVQVASSAVPIPGPIVEQGVRVAMTDPRVRAAMTDPGTRVAMTDQVVRAAMVDQGTEWTMAGTPPPQILLGKSTTSGGALWSGLCELLDLSGLWSGLCELLDLSGLWSGLCELPGALTLGGAREALLPEGAVSEQAPEGAVSEQAPA